MGCCLAVGGGVRRWTRGRDGIRMACRLQRHLHASAGQCSESQSYTLEALRSGHETKTLNGDDPAHLLQRPTTRRREGRTGSMRMLILGAPGSGKGTLSTRLVESLSHLPLHHLSSGDLLRRQIVKGTNLGRMAKELMDRGQMVHDDLMVGLIGSELPSQAATAAGTTTGDTASAGSVNFLLDGFPRNRTQAVTLDQSMRARGTPLNLIINLDVPEEIILNRIKDRYVHIPSGRIYNLSYSPPKTPGKDDITGEPLTKRDDDKPEIFQSRLEHYRAVTHPLLDYYRQAYDTWSSMQSTSSGVVRTFTGATSDEIFPQIIKAIEDRFEVRARI